jgi:hypothetical protein
VLVGWNAAANDDIAAEFDGLEDDDLDSQQYKSSSEEVATDE